MHPRPLIAQLLQHRAIGPVVAFDRENDRLLPFDFTGSAQEPTAATVADLPAFTAWVEHRLQITGCKYGIGGYGENRILYVSKPLFGREEEPRSLHLGTDIWGPAGTVIYCPLDAKVHSFAFNDHYGDYGATIILAHELDGTTLYSLYGHLSLRSLEGLTPGKHIPAGAAFAEFGAENENGHWPPHLHFQLVTDMEGREGDFPGVCKVSEKDRWLAVCPDPQLILAHTF